MFEVEFELVTVEDVKSLFKESPGPVFHKTKDPYKALRRREGPVVLEGFARSWLEGLPRYARPTTLASQYPRIVNRIAAVWQVDDRALDYLRELTVDTRGNRQGFPLAVKQELNALRLTLLERIQKKDVSAWALEPVSR